MQDSKVYVTLHGVKNPRLLFPYQVSVALLKGFLNIFHWYSKPNSCGIFTFKEPDSKILSLSNHIFLVIFCMVCLIQW